ncbi:MAG: zf-TFIIB domain-containing protein [bacterium]
MNCPVCDDRMRPVMRNGVEIDICPSCKGIWLDRGELDKLIAMEANGSYEQQRPVEHLSSAPRRSHEDHDDHDDHDRKGKYEDRDSHGRNDSHSSSGRPQQRKGSWLGDILGGIGGGDD